MSNIETRKFPNGGYDVVIVKKDDILATIEQNIIDREIMTEVIEQLEVDVTNFLKEERWTGIPFIGNIRIPPVKKAALKRRSLQKYIYENESRETYLMFIKQSALEDDRVIKYNRFYRHITSIAVTRNNKRFREIAKQHGNLYAKLFIFFKAMIKPINNEFLIIDDIDGTT